MLSMLDKVQIHISGPTPKMTLLRPIKNLTDFDFMLYQTEALTAYFIHK